jgi:Domain of unknown function (DUF5710)
MNATSNIALKVPFNEKDQAKSLGARWNAEAKHWYVPQGVDAAPFEKWFTNSSTPEQAPSTTSPVRKAKANTSQNQPVEDDIDAINARLRDAYEAYDGDGF